jgi:hypothetical protein
MFYDGKVTYPATLKKSKKSLLIPQEGFLFILSDIKVDTKHKVKPKPCEMYSTFCEIII